MTDIVERLKKWERLQIGEALPNPMHGDGKWGVNIAIDICDAIAEIEHLRSVARSVTWGDGDYRGVIEWCGRRYAIGPRWSRLAGPDSRTITKAARHDLCGNE